MPTPWSKAGAILDRQVNGRWLMYFGEGSIYHAWSDDLIHWEPCPQDEPLMLPTPPGTFGEFLVEVGPQPIVTNNGLILLLHNAAVKFEDGTVRYTCGQLLFDPERPTEILAQMNYPWLEPTTTRTSTGWSSNVTFVEGLVHFQGTWFAYYGQSDSTLGVATYKVGETYGGLDGAAPRPTYAGAVSDQLVVGFDLDMTLIDTVVGFAATLDVLGAELGVEFPTEEMTSRLGPPLDLMLEPHLAGRADPGRRPTGSARSIPRRGGADAGVPGGGRGAGRRTPPPRADRAGHRQVHAQRPAARRPPRARRRRRRGPGLGRRQGRGAAPRTGPTSTSATTSTTSRARRAAGISQRLGADRRLHPRGAGARPAPTWCSTDLTEFPAWLDGHLLDDPAGRRSRSRCARTAG